MRIQASLKPFSLSVKFKEDTTPTMGMMGFSTIVQYASLSPGEYNPILQGAKAVTMYDRMRRSDGQVNAIELLTSLPVCAMNYEVTPGGKSATDKEAATLVQSNLLEGMAVTWQDLLRQQLLCDMYGYSLHEKVFTTDGKYIRWEQMFHLAHTSIEEFIYDGGYLTGVKQSGSTYDGTYKEQIIPADKLMVTTYRSEAGSRAGFPLCRPMYKHWWCKDVAYTVLGMAIERLILGTPVAKVKSGMNPKQRNALRDMLDNIRARDKMGIVIDDDILLEMFESKRDLKIVLDYINHHDVLMARTALAQFLNLGSSDTGAYSVSEDHSKLFMISEQALADMICDVYNRLVIPQLCQYNWPGLQVFPKLIHSHVRTVLKLEGVLEALAHLVAGQLVTPDMPLEQNIRRLLDLPELEQSTAREVHPQGDDPTDDDNEGSKSEKPAGENDKERATAPAQIALAFDHDDACAHTFAERDVTAIGTLFEQTSDTFQKTAGKLLDDMVTKLSKAAENSLKKINKPFSRARLAPILAKLELPGRDRYATAVRDYLQALVDGGRAAYREATGNEPPAQSADLTHYLKAQSELLADRHVAELRHVFIQQVLSGSLSGVTVAQAVADAGQASRDRLNADFNRWFRDAAIALADQLSSAFETP